MSASTPITDVAYKRGEDAPDGLLAVVVSLSRTLVAEYVHGGTTTARWRAFSEYDASGPLGPGFQSSVECERWIEQFSPERDVTYFVGLHENGAVNVDAAVERAEQDAPGWVYNDWRAG
jgi:hypothetical protein